MINRAALQFHLDPRIAKAQRALQEAVACQRSGQDADAARLYARLLKKHPDYFDALQLNGLFKLQQGQLAAALDLFRRALKVNPQSISVLNALGVVLCNLDRFAEAATFFDRSLLLDPDNPHTLNNSGNALTELKRHHEALAAYDRALALKPELSDAWLGRGNLLVALKRYDEALAAYDQALLLRPGLANAWLGRGNLFVELKQYDQAGAAFDTALALAPEAPKVWLGRGDLLIALRRYDEAFLAYDRALGLKPDCVQAWLRRGRNRCLQGQLDGGLKDYKQALDLGGDRDAIGFEMAQFSAATLPAAMPPSVVIDIFDRYADGFDDSLVGDLNYRTPVELRDLIGAVRLPGNLNALDLGCGTGLMGVQLRGIAATLTGVDLSARMLEKAAQRAIYDTLVCGEITAFLSDNAQTYGLITATDVFVYMGDLAATFRFVSRALDHDGLFCFSVEAAASGDVVLRQTGRYAHSRDYLTALADACGFVLERLKPSVLRQESGTNVDGYIVLLRCGNIA